MLHDFVLVAHARFELLQVQNPLLLQPLVLLVGILEGILPIVCVGLRFVAVKLPLRRVFVLDEFSGLKFPDLFKSLCQELVSVILLSLEVVDFSGHSIDLLCELQLSVFLALELIVQCLL